MSSKRYSGDILQGHKRRQTPTFPDLPAQQGMVLEVVGEDFVGALIDIDKTFSGLAGYRMSVQKSQLHLVSG